MAVEGGRRPIGVAQGPGQGGDNFPIVQPSVDIERLLADAYLAYIDNTNKFTPPFHIKYLHGFGTDIVSVPITPVHTHDVEIQDNTGLVVFNSLVATDFKEEAWAGIRKILEWTDAAGQILRIVYHTEFGLNDVTRTYDIYIEPAAAQLDGRVPYQIPKRVTSFRIGLSTLKAANVVFRNGFNTKVIAADPVVVDGDRRTTDVTLSAEAGSGAGRFGPACDELDSPIRRINGVGPNDRGNFLLDATDCYRVERPVQSTLQASPRQVQIRDHTLRISNDCGPCCECDDFIAVWEAIRKLTVKYTDLITRTQAARDQYHANRQRYLDDLECRLDDRLRFLMEPICPDEVGVAVGWCNNTTQCLTGLIIHISFAYVDGTGKCTALGGGALTASTTAVFSELPCASTFRDGNIIKSPLGETPGRRELYTLGGTWPHFWAIWDQVDPGGMATATFRIKFDTPTPTQVVEGIAEAFVVPPADQVSTPGLSPVPGYTLGSGPLTTPAINRLMECPALRSASLAACCPE